MARTESFPFGIASVGLHQVERQIPNDEPPPLEVAQQRNVRREGATRGLGTEKRVDDVNRHSDSNEHG